MSERTPGRGGQEKEAQPTPLVGVIMGSDSDLKVMIKAHEILKDLEIPHGVDIVSAHRTPNYLYEYAESAAERGLRIIIAGAGGAAHLPGMVAAKTDLPVIGVPVTSSALSGQDSLLSIVQMPPGIPVATMAIDGAENAGLLAARILAGEDENLRFRLHRYQKRMENLVRTKSEKILRVGPDEYLDQMPKDPKKAEEEGKK